MFITLKVCHLPSYHIKTKNTLDSDWTDWKNSNDGTCRERRTRKSISKSIKTRGTAVEHRKRTSTTTPCGIKLDKKRI